MHRTRWTGMALLLLSLVAATLAVQANGRMLSEDDLTAVRGGDVWYCSIPSVVGQGCYACNFIQWCSITDPNGNVINYPTYTQCTLAQYDVLCYVTPMSSAPPAPMCQSITRGSSSGPAPTNLFSRQGLRAGSLNSNRTSGASSRGYPSRDVV